MMKTIEREESGQTLVYVALSLVTLLLFVALAIEAGHLYAERRRMQNAADAGALAGVRESCLGRLRRWPWPLRATMRSPGMARPGQRR